MFKKIISFSFMVGMLSYAQSQNTGYICSSCGVFDLSEITFSENIDQLTSKGEPFKTVFTNENCAEKRTDEVDKKDQICGFKYSIHKKEKDPQFLSFSGQVRFDHLYMLTNPDQSLVAYTIISDFNGNEKDFQSLVEMLTKKFNVKPKYNTLMLDGSLVYQWDAPAYICQVIRSKDKRQRESTVNGKTKTDSFYNLSLGLYQKNKLDPKMKELIRHNESFVIYTDKNFGK